MKNLEIRTQLMANDIKIHQLAKKLKITRTSLSRKLRYELSEKEKNRLLNAIEEIKKESN